MQTVISLPRALAGSMAIVAVLITSLQLVHAAPHTKISAARANAIVLKRFPGKVTEKTTLENEEGKWQYGVMVLSGHTLREVMVDANNGKIASVEVTTQAKEQEEKKKDAAAAHHKTKEKEQGEANEKGEDGEEKD